MHITFQNSPKIHFSDSSEQRKLMIITDGKQSEHQKSVNSASEDSRSSWLLFEIFTRNTYCTLNGKKVIGLKIFSPSLTIIVHKMIIFHDLQRIPIFENGILPHIPLNNTDS